LIKEGQQIGEKELETFENDAASTKLFL